jgi:hypothetical protein
MQVVEGFLNDDDILQAFARMDDQKAWDKLHAAIFRN